MLLDFIRQKDRADSLSEFAEFIRQGMPLAAFGVPEAYKCALVAVVDSPVLLVVKDNLTALSAVKAITELSGKSAVFLPPKDETLLLSAAFSKDSLYNRIIASTKIKTAQVLVSTYEALMQSLPREVKIITFEIGKEYFRDDVIKELLSMGYLRSDSADSKGTFAVRGDILDIFSIDHINPCRINFFGDTIENIKNFNAETRENLGYVKSVSVLSAVETIFSKTELALLKKAVYDEVRSSSPTAKTRLKAIAEDMIREIENENYSALSVFNPLTQNIAFIDELLPKNAVVIFDEAKRINETATLNETEYTERFNSLYREGETFSFAINQFISKDTLTEKLKEHRLAAIQTLSTAVPFFNPLKIINPTVSAVANYRLDFKEVFTDINNWLKNSYDILVCTADLNRANNLNSDLSAMGIASSINGEKAQGVNILTVPLGSGFVLHERKLVILGSGNLYARASANGKPKTKKQTFFTAPETGDYAVHEVHGIGRVLGSKKITTAEGTKDYVSVEYSGGDILYVPVEQMDILTRYLGAEKKPKLSKIGGKDFERIKNNAKASIKKMSFDLKKLYEERKTAKGFKFNEETELQEVFDDAFEFEDTVDQTSANEEIRADMTSEYVMDRLICGDVGYGKTEVAFRAVFRAIANGKQAAMLAPTTILTEQHYNTALKRFEHFGIKIACLNRFRTDKEQRKIIEELKDGKIDFVIGTHRLLSSDIGFKDLGLLVLDEEQRFGVEHKEKIKLLKKNVDTLTLSATPIPRTLHMSLTGIRSISTINTPPKKRLPVQTYVAEQTDALIRDAVNREVNRGGQVFILYNRVESIFTFASYLKDLIPNIKLTVVHGQMEEKALERDVTAFYKGGYDVLLSTTIIENGIDLPRANTIIVIDADKLGLSTLYQLKGRVGRSDRLAYAYFTFKREKILSETAYQRLNALMEFAEMGSGIKIAMRDLEIRGAGNVLGSEQHGHMDKIGYELYSKLLREELSGEEENALDLDIRVTAFIPDYYIESNSAKMDAYKEIAEIENIEDEQAVRRTLIETFGALPIETENLINIAVVKRYAIKIGVCAVNIKKDETSLSFVDLSAFKNKKIMDTVDKFGDEVFFSVSGKPRLVFVRGALNNKELLLKMRNFLSMTV